jgi:hypothetical protein
MPHLPFVTFSDHTFRMALPQKKERILMPGDIIGFSPSFCTYEVLDVNYKIGTGRLKNTATDYVIPFTIPLTGFVFIDEQPEHIKQSYRKQFYKTQQQHERRPRSNGTGHE